MNKNLWKENITPSRLIGNLYFVGTRPASTHIIDTGEGLILIDPGYIESLHIVIDNMWSLGFNPRDIKYIIGTHAHFDHIDAVEALVEMTGAKTLIGKADLPLLKGEIYHYPLNTFEPDILIEDGDTLALGNTSIKFMHTPGHTDGTISFFFDVKENGETYRAGMFGGAGCNTLAREFIDKNNLSFDCREKFIDSIKRLKKEKVEIFLGNHVGNNNTVGKIEKLSESGRNPFIDPDGWQIFLDKKLEEINDIIRNNK